MTQQELEAKQIRDEIFRVRMRLELLKAKADNPLYNEEYTNAKRELAEVKKKYAKFKSNNFIKEKDGQGRK